MQLRTTDGLEVVAFADAEGASVAFPVARPLFTLLMDDERVGSHQAVARGSDPVSLRFENGVTAVVVVEAEHTPGWKAVVTFTNGAGSHVKLENVVPFGEHPDQVYITAAGAPSLARTMLFRPGESPIGVILPDNAWEMGYGAVSTSTERSVAAIARRTGFTEAERTRWHIALQPGGTVEYTFYADAFTGSWQDGLRLMFRDRYLYDLPHFDNALFERDDLKWIRDQYLISLQMAWDHEFVDSESGELRFEQFLADHEPLLGGYDVYGLWPTWPRLGIDQRNQWDMYRDLPGGLERLRELSRTARERGTRFFIAYNPWDEDTRAEDHLAGMATLIEATEADGVILDTKGGSSRELQDAADSVREGVVMFSEGMAVPRDMPGIVSGRVHDAIRMPPPLNLNKLIKPDFSIFRVGQLTDGHLRRDAAITLFNGYGMEINSFFPGRPPWIEEAFRYLGRTTRILRENSSAFSAYEWTPLIESLRDSIWVNRWPDQDKTLYTVLSMVPEGHDGPLFPVEEEANVRYVDLWRHVEVVPDTIDGRLYVPLTVDAYHSSLAGTRQEGSASAVAVFPSLLVADVDVDSLSIQAPRGDRIVVWAGDPSYERQPRAFDVHPRTVSLLELFGRHEGKYVVQLFEGERLIDQRDMYVEPGTPRLVSRTTRTETPPDVPDGMVHVPGATITPDLKDRGRGNSGILVYPAYYREGRLHRIDPFYMDRYPVTNIEFQEFLQATNYMPEDPTNFLKHWTDGQIPAGMEQHPVVYVSLGDVEAYADWRGKRLPTEGEWQLAAQGTDGRTWPWGSDFDSTRVNAGTGRTTPVDAHPRGASPYGVEDLVGNVWQITNDVYDNGSYRFAILRGGSHYQPTSSWWYAQGGPVPLDQRQSLLLVSPSFDRNATVGFRLAMDAPPGASP